MRWHAGCFAHVCVCVPVRCAAAHPEALGMMGYPGMVGVCACAYARDGAFALKHSQLSARVRVKADVCAGTHACACRCVCLCKHVSESIGVGACVCGCGRRGVLSFAQA